MPVFLWMKSFVPCGIGREASGLCKIREKELSLSVYKKNQAELGFIAMDLD